jgi:hypothetical protein
VPPRCRRRVQRGVVHFDACNTFENYASLVRGPRRTLHGRLLLEFTGDEIDELIDTTT